MKRAMHHRSNAGLMMHYANTSPEQQSFNDVLLENGPSQEEQVRETLSVFDLLFEKLLKFSSLFSV